MFSCKTWKVPNEWDDEYEDTDEIIFCDVCEEDFYSQQSYEKHVAGHRVCGLDGCQYAAHEKLVEKHIETQHLTGLYEKIRSVNTPEEISKWIEERKVRYPTKENVRKRFERQEEMVKRGERIGERKNRFGRDKTRLSRVKQKRPTRRLKPKVRVTQKTKESLIDEKCDWNGEMFPFRGTKELYNEGVEDKTSDYDDDEWSLETSSSKVTVPLNNALGALMGAYKSDEEDNDNEAPTEQKIQKEQTQYPTEQEQGIKIVKRNKKRKTVKGKEINKVPKLDDSNKSLQSGLSQIKFFKRRVTLLEKLLDSEIRHERNVLLQCVQFVVGNNFLKDV